MATTLVTSDTSGMSIYSFLWQTCMCQKFLVSMLNALYTAACTVEESKYQPVSAECFNPFPTSTTENFTSSSQPQLQQVGAWLIWLKNFRIWMTIIIYIYFFLIFVSYCVILGAASWLCSKTGQLHCGSSRASPCCSHNNTSTRLCA